jgi:hypothetical protein
VASVPFSLSGRLSGSHNRRTFREPLRVYSCDKGAGADIATQSIDL